MSESGRGTDHTVRIASLRAFEASLIRSVEAGLAELGTLDDPVRVHAALQLLVQNDRFRDAVDLVGGYPFHCKWIDLAVYAHVALRDVESAGTLLEFARESCESAWVADRCRIAVADAAYCEVLNDSAGGGTAVGEGLTDEDRVLLEFVIEALNPIVAPVRLSGRVDSAIQRAAVESATHAYGLLGQYSQITDLVQPMVRCRPVPLLLAQLALRRLCEPPKGLSGRLRVEHPNSFSAAFLAALLDREVYGRSRESLNSLIDLQLLARDNGKEAIEQLCQALFETASAMDAAALARARSVVDGLLGTSNRYRLYFDTVALLLQDRPDAALTELNAHRREDDAVWWQISAEAHELVDDPDKAMQCWERACQLMPHPDMINRFAGMSIQQHRFEDAVRALKTAVVHSPDDARLLEQLAFAHTRLRQFSEAGALFEQLIHLHPDVTKYRINLALCQVHSGDPNSALASLDTVVDPSQPDLQLIGLRTKILTSLNRAREAFTDLQRLQGCFASDVRFLLLYMDTAYRAGEDKAADSAFQQLLEMQQSGQLSEPLFDSMSLDDIKTMHAEQVRQRESLFSEVVRGKIPWLVADALLGVVADQAWHRRTQRLVWLPDDLPSRGESTIYATNGFSVQKDSHGRPTVARIGVPCPGEPVVADMSAIITLHRLGRLSLAANYFGKLILPASFGELPLRDAQQLTAHQPSREQELRSIHDLVQRRLITVIEDCDLAEGTPLVDEYGIDEEEHRFALADVAEFLRATQRLTSDELGEFSRVCQRAIQGDREIPRDSRVLFSVSTLRSLTQYEWLERVLPTVNWGVARTDYDDEVRELQDYEFQRTIFSSHQRMWEEINQLRAGGILEYRNSASCRRDCPDGSDGDDVEPPPFVDAFLLAHDLGCRLLADDRLCQAAVLNQRPEISDAAFGTDRLLIGLEDKGGLSTDDVCADLIQMMRWRYRFLLPESRHLKVAALRSRDSLPGPELREIAAYVQESMRDPGLFCGPEKADLPTPLAFKYFMAWKEVCVEFLGALWEESSIGSPQLEAVTRWCIESLLPAVPRGMLYSPVGRRLGDFTPKAFMLTAMIRFATVQPVQRASDALLLMASQLGMTEDEFYEAAAEAADGGYD
ncbi:Tetratricopeptide repeat protein [Maioricimonas rarisocia]|uniref:Tetratricopeptide repeat protein n=1 Tax=Maioricimonas rarisocia TaxID=2528026 RepID=A0A517ZB41_9PLAN|nr:tetratricopeptide repeat protein [Maioricimonas rarisocia]QDU39712.1 Tetratricopeptide repeat protein [Maioricimonas rarisocia]